MKKLVLGVLALVVAWLWSRGARDPREWPTRLPQEISALRDDVMDAVAAGRRAGAGEEAAFAARFEDSGIVRA